MFSLDSFKSTIKKAFKQVENDQAEALSIEIAANYTAGRTAGEKHKSIRWLNFEPCNSADPEQEEDGLTTEEKAEIATLTALYLGYIAGFNKAAQDQILIKAEEIIQAGGSEQEVKKYVDNIFTGKENIVIDNIGKTRKELYVDKNLKISEVEKVITKKYTTSINNYVQLLGERASHSSYEAGRKSNLIKQGYEKWVFVGPADERARPWHVALLGQVYTWNTQQSSYAERCLQEPRCRHHAQIFYNDPEKDIPAKFWQAQKDEAGLYWDNKEQRWGMKTYEVKKNKTPLTKVEKNNTKPVKVKVKKEIEKTPKVKPITKTPKVIKEKEVPKVEVKKTPEEVNKFIRENEQTIKNRTTEKAFIFDKKGKILLEKEGVAHAVELSDDELKLLKGNILTHNHPSGGSFSGQDIKTACRHGVNEVRATGAKGTYIMKVKDGANFTKELWDEKISEIYDKTFKEELLKHNMRMADGEITKEESVQLLSKVLWVKVTRNVPELEYSFVKW